MPDNKEQKEGKKTLTIEEMEFVSRGDIHEKLEVLLASATIPESEKNKWRTTINEVGDFYENAPCAYMTIDDTGLILKINQTGLNWIGYTKDEVVNKKSLWEFLPEKNLNFYKYLPLLRENGHIDQLEGEFLRKDGSTKYSLTSARAIYDKDGNFKWARVTMWDITDRKKMEDEMLKVNRHLRSVNERIEEKGSLVQKLNEELLLVKKERAELINTLSTDLEKPLEKALIQNRSAMNAPSVANTEVHTKLNKVEDALNQLCSLVNNFKVHQRISTDKTNLQISKFNFSKMLIMGVGLLEEQAEKKKITINYEIYEELWLKSDRQYMAQIIDSLLFVAMRLSMPGKEIPLRLIRKVNECVVELEISGFNMKQKEFIELIQKKIEPSSAGRNRDTGMTMNSHLISSLVDILGCELTVSPKDGRDTLIRLSIPLK